MNAPFKGNTFMNIHEYQAKELLRRYAVATPDGKVAQDAEDLSLIHI